MAVKRPAPLYSMIGKSRTVCFVRVCWLFNHSEQEHAQDT